VSNIYDSEPRTLRVGRVKLPWPFPISYCINGSSARVFGRPVFGSKCPVWLMPVYRLFRAGHNARWALLHRYHRRYQYNVIRPDLRPGYYDVDTLMLYGVMALVSRYVEGERGGEEKLEAWGKELIDPANNDPNAPEGMVEAQGQRELDVLDIYRWWKHERPANEARRDELLHALYGRGRMSFKTTDHPKLRELVFAPFEGDEVAMNKEFRALEDRIAADEQKFLHLAVDLRGSMWT
jgi:hypothetical protein